MKSRQTNALLIAVSCIALTFTGSALAQGRPETPGKPETPAAPEKPETPVVPDEKPETPEAPEKPETPVVPEQKPETPATPEKPEKPEKREDGDLEDPEIEDPEVEDPEVEIEDPEVEDPKVEIEDPEVEDPEVEKPKVEKPEKENMRPDFVNDLKAARDSYNEDRKALRDALKAELAALGSEATKEQIEKAVSDFREANAGLIAAQKAAAEEIKFAAKEEIRGNAPAHVVEMRQNLRNVKDARKAARDAFKAALAGAETKEDKKALIDAFRTEQRDQHKQLKDELKKLREETRSVANDGDRRLDE